MGDIIAGKIVIIYYITDPLLTFFQYKVNSADNIAFLCSFLMCYLKNGIIHIYLDGFERVLTR